MADGREPVTVKVVSRLADIAAAEWDACAGEDNPFLSHAFLDALETSGSATAETGWQAQHLALAGDDGRLLGVVPLYLKSHSYGEYIFDWGWASAYEQAGGRYYPKLQCAVPFTPVTGADGRHSRATCLCMIQRPNDELLVKQWFSLLAPAGQ
jgi:hypothetical protein